MFYTYLTVAGIEVFWPGIILLGMSIGFLTGLFGVGGGFLLTPCLKFIIGVPFNVAVGSDLAQIFVTGSYSAYKHKKKNNVDMKLGALMAVGAMLGTLAGAEILGLFTDKGPHIMFEGQKIELQGDKYKQFAKVGDKTYDLEGEGTAAFITIGAEKYLREYTQPAPRITINGREQALLDIVLSGLFLLLMLFVGGTILRETSKNKGTASNDVDSGIAKKLQKICIPPIMSFDTSGIKTLSMWMPLGISFCVGILTGLLGVGGGFVMFPLLVYVLGLPTAIAVGTSAFQIVFATGIGTVKHYFDGNVDFKMVGLMLAGSLVGATVGVYVSGKIGGHKIRKYFAGVLALGVLVVVIGLLNQIYG